MNEVRRMVNSQINYNMIISVKSPINLICKVIKVDKIS